MAKPKDKEPSTNDEVKRGEDFQDKVDMNEKVLAKIKELLESTTEEEFSKLGYERNENKAGVYADEKEYGSGAEENKYQIKLAGKTKNSIEKQIVFGAKRVQSDINIVFKGNVLNLEYKTTENGFFRGADKDSKYTGNGKSIMVNEKLSAPAKNMKDLEKKLKELFKDAAKREVSYLVDTKLGVEDKISAGTASVVNEETMEKLTLKSFFSDDAENINEEIEQNIDKVKSSNTIPLEKVKPDSDSSDKGKYLFFDASEVDNKQLEEIMAKHSGLNRDEYRDFVGAEMKKKFGTDKLNELTPVEKKELFNHIDNIYSSKQEVPVNEITTSGPANAVGAPSGAGGYNTPFAFKNTSYSKGKSNKRPKVDKNYNILPETKANKDGFWQVVNVDPNYHPQGMPFVKPGSKEELNNTVRGDKNKMKRMGIKEGAEPKLVEAKKDLTKKKHFSEQENIQKGINKRYLITEKTSDEYLKERWAKLSVFKINESIKEAEEMNEAFNASYDEVLNESYIKVIPSVKEVKKEEPKELISENTNSNANAGEETVNVEKPGSKFGTEYKFYKKDFLNESKNYILDLNSMVFVPNPNAK